MYTHTRKGGDREKLGGGVLVREHHLKFLFQVMYKVAQKGQAVLLQSRYVSKSYLPCKQDVLPR